MSNKQFNYDKSFDLEKWIKTDELQVVKKIGFDGDNFEFISIDHFELDDEIIIKKQNINFNMFDNDVENYAMFYGYNNVYDIIAIYKEQAPTIIAEIISELNILNGGEVIGRIPPNTNNTVREFDKIVNDYIISNNL